MSLIKCKECEAEISDSAKACPKCGAPVPKKRGIGTWIAVAFVGWIVYACAGAFNAVTEGGTSSGSGDYLVTYHVEGTSTSSASLTYQNDQGGSQQEKVSLPWSKSYRVRPGAFLYISAQNQEQYGGLEVRITVDGKPFKRSESMGAYTIAQASGSCCR